MKDSGKKRRVSINSNDVLNEMVEGTTLEINDVSHTQRMEDSSRLNGGDSLMNQQPTSMSNQNQASDVNKIKKPPAKRALSKQLCVLYAVVLTLIGFFFPLTEALTDRWHETIYNMVFQILIFTLAIAFLVYLQFRLIPISKAKLRKQKQQKRQDRIRGTNLQIQDPNSGSNGGVIQSRGDGNIGDGLGEEEVFLSQDSHPLNKVQILVDISKLGNAYSHQGSNMYLRLGALLFALCNIIYIGLEIENSVRANQTEDCDVIKYWWTFIFRLAFLLTQSFLIFKNSKIEVCLQQPLARFGFMHLVATNMCVWLQTIMNEIKEEYHHEQLSLMPQLNISNEDTSEELDHHSTETPELNDECQYYAGILRDASPYLYPFVLEYSLIAIGMLAFMITSIDEEGHSKVIRGLQHLFQVRNFEWDQGGPNDRPFSVTSQHSHGRGHMKLEKSHRGMFSGALLLAGSFLSIFFFFFMTDYKDLIYFSSDLSMHVFLLLATLIGSYQMHQLSFIEKPPSIDDVFLGIAMSGAFIYEMTLIIPSAAYLRGSKGPSADPRFNIEVLKLTSSVVAGVQTLAQSMLVVSGLRKYCSKQSQLKKMPGRGIITFLIIGNVAVWISRTLQTKQINYITEQNYFGFIASLLLLDTNLPLLVFFRFHSSVCLAEIWSSAYSPMHKELPQKFVSQRNQNLHQNLNHNIDTINLADENQTRSDSNPQQSNEQVVHFQLNPDDRPTPERRLVGEGAGVDLGRAGLPLTSRV